MIFDQIIEITAKALDIRYTLMEHHLVDIHREARDQGFEWGIQMYRIFRPLIRT